MNQGRDATRRNRNIGTAKQGRGQNNRLVIPWCGLKLYYENLTEYKVAERTVHSRSLPFIVEKTRADSCHACTVDDIARVLQYAPFSDFFGIDFIVLRQPKRKEEIINPVWGRLAYFAEIGPYQGRAIFLEALNPSRPLRWSKSLTPDGQQEMERLREAGHEIITTRHYHKVTVSLESIRAHQLYHTLLHEIGHSLDKDRDPDAFDRKSSLEKETFAHQYADKLRENLVRFGIIPFARMLDKQTIARDGLSVSDFTAD
ncbi:MAG TPA: hypothetical protein VFV58_23520 [Blastocatellia bacterium]|jgi:hypothetical protein|nr:hypothetical protein [Blastocatellia bacterium]